MISHRCPECTSPRTAETVDIRTGDRDRMCATCGHHWYPAPLQPGLPRCCAQTIQSRPRPGTRGSMLTCSLCGRPLVLRDRWMIYEDPDEPDVPLTDPAHHDAGDSVSQEAARPPYMGKFALEPVPGMFGEPVTDHPSPPPQAPFEQQPGRRAREARAPHGE